MVDELRPIAEDEYEAWQRVLAAGFSEVPEPAQLAQWRANFEFDRTLAAFEHGEIVGTTAALSFQMHVPGGAMVPTAGVTAVTVLPSHTRQGVLTAMMRRQLEDVHERGEPLAALQASESLIYGRFGYGVAIPAEQWRIDRVRARFLRPPAEETGGRVRIVQRPEALERFPSVYERSVSAVHGELRHPDSRWASIYGPGEWEEHARKEEPFLALFERDGADEGYVTYAVKALPVPSDVPGSPAPRMLTVRAFAAATPEAHEALWRFIFAVDLIDTILTYNRAIDDPLPWMLFDPRRLRRSVFDMIWLRLVDVPAALAARTYSSPGRVTIEVRDSFCPWNAGLYALEADDRGAATCEPVRGAPDLTLDVDSLAAAYLGATSLTALARSGRVDEHTADALERASAMFRTDRAPSANLDF